MASLQHSSYEPYRSVREPDFEDAETLLTTSPDRHIDSITKEKVHVKFAKWSNNHLRTALRFLALLIAMSVVGIQAHTAFIWMDTRHETYYNSSTGFRTNSWAIIEGWPTWLMLGVAAFGTLVQALALTSLCSCFQGLHDGVLHAVSVYLSSIALLASWIAALVAFRVVYSKGKAKDHFDIWFWSCYRKGSEDAIPWDALCAEQTYTFAAAIIAVVVEVICVALFLAHHRGYKPHLSYKGMGSTVKSWVPGSRGGYRAASRS